ncbi:hypothetical protein ACDQ55_20475 [Chitinophaga sp. 30R24]|uniref:hypothetical protein n=1 Tax=Chitinophaga sp. 30R24 TaxID=3248838 RepID=UPI003B8FDA50
MVNKIEFTSFVESLFKEKKVHVQNFDSGCVMLDVYINEMDMLVLQIEDTLIGVSLIKDYINHIDLSTISDITFSSNEEAENYLINLGID